MEIRLIQPSDTKAFVAFYKKLTSETDYMLFTPAETSQKAAKEEDFIKKYDDYKQVFIAEEDGKIVGYLGIGRSHLEKLTHVAKLTVGVLEDHKRQGIATKLIKFAEKWAKEKGVKRLELTVVTKNKPAVTLFQKTGFKEEGTRKKSMKIEEKYFDEFLMAKTL